MKRAIAIGLTALSLSVAASGSARAFNNPCWWDVPVIGAGVAFFELLRDEERDRHCGHYADEGELVVEPAPLAPEAYRERKPVHAKHGKDLPPK